MYTEAGSTVRREGRESIRLALALLWGLSIVKAVAGDEAGDHNRIADNKCYGVVEICCVLCRYSKTVVLNCSNQSMNVPKKWRTIIQ